MSLNNFVGNIYDKIVHFYQLNFIFGTKLFSFGMCLSGY